MPKDARRASLHGLSAARTVKIFCKKHHQYFNQTPNAHLSGSGCPKCGVQKISKGVTLTTSEFIQKANAIHKNKYDYSLTKYIDCETEVKIICPTHGIFKQKAHNHLKGGGCKKCFLDRLSKRTKMDKKIFIKRAKILHKNKYNYSLSCYKGYDIPLKIICKKHGCFLQTPHSHLAGRGCVICGYQTVSSKLSISRNVFLKKAKLVHNNRYNYKLVVYTGDASKIKIICPDHGVFKQTPHSHLAGSGCPKCSNNYKLSIRSFVKKAAKIHNNKYNYQLIKQLKNTKVKVKIICPLHGIFKQKPNSHLNGSGCPRCGIDKCVSVHKISSRSIVIRANKIHHHKYKYNMKNYNGIGGKIEILCPKHGSFFLPVASHIYQETGCPQCKIGTSKIEIQWLDYMGIKRKFRHIKITANNHKYKVDGYSPKTKTIYEFYGDYYHGNPKVFKKRGYNQVSHKTFGQLYKETKQREKILRKVGYKIVFVWERDFKAFLKSNNIKVYSCKTITRKLKSIKMRGQI